ncbi:MAG: AAA family ATPase, partial [Clostridia bacterium]|nr:AAA family ATPase [Clostridia bacterium]
MRLTKLEIYGFKSFAKRTEIVFPQNVTGIVGPNGSGKSNIGDAVRWVLGEQSAKMLRGQSMADVIFNGTEKRKALNYCEVTLTFDNTDHQLNVAFDEVSITRRVYRSGDSEYLMNGASCRLRDIVDLFRDTGVGKEGYSIIGQGRIDAILSQRSEERRVIFEEAAGISRFRSRKEEAESRLKRADENLVRVLDVLDELESHLTPLKKQSDTAKEYLALSDTLRELDVRLYLLRYDRLHEKETAAEQALLKVSDAVREAEAALGDAIDRRGQGEVKLEQIQQALSQAHDALLRQNDALHAARESLSEIRNRIQNGGDTIERLDGETDSLKARLRLIDATVNQSDGGMSEAEKLLSQAQQALEERRNAHASATEKAQKLEDELSAHKAHIMDRMNRMQNVRTSQARQSAMQQQMSARREEILSQLRQEEEREEEISEALKTAEENLKNEQALLDELKAGAEAFEQSTRQLLQDILARQKQMQEDLQSARAMDT